MSINSKWTVGENLVVIAVAILIMWSVIFVAAVAFLRIVVGTHTSWSWTIAPLGLAGGFVLVYLFYRAIFAPLYTPRLHEHRDFHDGEDRDDA